MSTTEHTHTPGQQQILNTHQASKCTGCGSPIYQRYDFGHPTTWKTGTLKGRYALVLVTVENYYLTGEREEPESEGWQIVEDRFKKNLWSDLPRVSCNFVQWEPEEEGDN